MAKRFTDTNKYRKPFIRGLQGAYKLFWDYLYHDCDHAGIWIIDFEIAQIYIGDDMPVNKEDALKYFNSDKIRIIEIDNNKKWFIPSFIEFQYSELNESNRAHNSVIMLLKKNGIYKNKGHIKGLISTSKGLKDKEKDKVKAKEKTKDLKKKNININKRINENKKIKYADSVLMTQDEYHKLLNLYGEKQTEKMIEILDNYKGSSGKTYKSDYKAVLTWVVKRYNEDQQKEKNGNVKIFKTKKQIMDEEKDKYWNDYYKDDESQNLF